MYHIQTLRAIPREPIYPLVSAFAASLTGKGYWLVGTDGGVFSFGDATFFGSAGSLRLNQPMVGLVVAK
jgi:hypothetical protein